MAKTIKDVISNTKTITMTDSALHTLMDFERVVDELDMYTFANWKKGELVEGPVYEKYFVTATFMWPYKFMPDPRAVERLTDYGCEVMYKQDKLEYPVKLKSAEDFKPGTKVAKKTSAPIWLVKIIMPKTLMQEIHQGSMELESGDVDLADIEAAYETGDDEDAYKNGDEAAPGAAPAAVPGAQNAAPAAVPGAQNAAPAV